MWGGKIESKNMEEQGERETQRERDIRNREVGREEQMKEKQK